MLAVVLRSSSSPVGSAHDTETSPLLSQQQIQSYHLVVHLVKQSIYSLFYFISKIVLSNPRITTCAISDSRFIIHWTFIEEKMWRLVIVLFGKMTTMLRNLETNLSISWLAPILVKSRRRFWCESFMKLITWTVIKN